MIESQVFKDTLLTIIHSVHIVNPSLRHKLLIERKKMKKLADIVVDMIKGVPLTNLVNKAVKQVLSSSHYQLSLSGPIERKVENLLKL